MVLRGAPAAAWERPSGPLRHPAGFALAVAAALALHAAVVWHRSSGVREMAPVSLARAMSVRSLSIPLPSKPPAVPEDPQTGRGEVAKLPAPLARPTAEALAESPPRSPRKMSAAARSDGAQSQTAPAPLANAASTAGQPASVEGGLRPAPDYLLGARLDPGPRPIGDIEPEYPDSANLQEGTVVLRLLISETGTVDDVGVVRAHPKGLFEQAAIEAFGKAKFHPGLVLGTAVKSQMMVEVHFLPINRGARISGRSY